MSALETVFLDAGGVLLYPNWWRISDALAEQGVSVAPDALIEADPRARRQLDDLQVVGGTTDASRGWLFFDLTYMFSLLQSVALGLAILLDRRTRPLFPRWVGYLCFLTAAIYVPLSLVPFVRTGPFAWHGLLNFWAVFAMFFVLIAVVTPYAFRAVRRLEHEDLAYVN